LPQRAVGAAGVEKFKNTTDFETAVPRDRDRRFLLRAVFLASGFFLRAVFFRCDFLLRRGFSGR
jgi:hypothetical protein